MVSLIIFFLVSFEEKPFFLYNISDSSPKYRAMFQKRTPFESSELEKAFVLNPKPVKEDLSNLANSLCKDKKVIRDWVFHWQHIEECKNLTSLSRASLITQNNHLSMQNIPSSCLDLSNKTQDNDSYSEKGLLSTSSTLSKQNMHDYRFSMGMEAKDLEELDFTQSQIGLAMGKLYDNEYSHITKSKFEILDLSIKNKCMLKPLVVKCLENADQSASNLKWWVLYFF
jgi:hypothetical protein